jgi:hypothetical protein
MRAPTYHFDLEQGSDRWLNTRLGKLTASNFGVASKPTKKATYNTLLMSIVGERLTGCIKSIRASAPMAHGSFWESNAREAYEESTGNFVIECGFVDHATIKNLGYSPDGLVGDDGLIEIKCPTLPVFLKWCRAGVVPEEHKPQMLEGILVSERKWCDFVTFFPSHDDAEALEDGDKKTFGEGSIPKSISIKIWRYTPTQEELVNAEKSAVSFLTEVDAAFDELKPEEDEF